MKKLLCLLSLVCFSCHFATAQETTSSPPPLVNKDVIEMVRSGMSAEVVLAKIRSSVCKFDTSPAALVALKEAGVSDDIMMEMVRNPAGQPTRVEPPRATSTPVATPVDTPPKEQPRPAADNLPEYGDISEIRKMRRVFVTADDIDSQNRLIRSLSGYGGLQVVNSPDDAEIFLAFTQGSLATSVRFRGLFAGTIDYRTKAQFIVYYRSESGRSRIVWRETEDIQTSSGLTLSRPNELNVIRHFIKELKKIRAE